MKKVNVSNIFAFAMFIAGLVMCMAYDNGASLNLSFIAGTISFLVSWLVPNVIQLKKDMESYKAERTEIISDIREFAKERSSEVVKVLLSRLNKGYGLTSVEVDNYSVEDAEFWNSVGVKAEKYDRTLDGEHMSCVEKRYGLKLSV